MSGQQIEKDLQIIQEVLSGNQQAFAELVDRYKNYVFSICLRVLKKREDAEEAAQDTFLKVYKTLGSFEQKSKFSTWLYTVAYRTALDKTRKKQPYTQSINGESTDGPSLQIAVEKTAQPDIQMHNMDLKDHLEKAIQQLPTADASIISLFYLHERSVKEVAEIMNMTETNIKTKLHRLRERLKVKLNQYLEAEIQDLI
jgi:RNA polymerase sigma-70 factor (ECF subfamily)